MKTEPKVYVVQGQEIFHASLSCRDLRERTYEGISWCLARNAHFSRVRPCPSCSSELLAVLRARYGSMPSGERASRGYPRLWPLTPADLGDDEAPEFELPYGPARELDDPRFSNSSALDWGTSTYGQDPNEYLGDVVDDDNDWRGHGASR
jgi:hypothetical protein